MTKGVRAALTLLLFAAVGGVIAWAALVFTSYPPTVAAASSRGQATMTLQTVGTIGFGPHPLWVSYLARTPQGKWVHTTIIKLPAHSTIHATVYNYDTTGPLRNAAIGQVQGTLGGVMYVNGKPLSYVNANNATAPGHTFTVPDLGLSVPLTGVNPNLNNVCGAAPCTTSSPHKIITFTFRTQGPGLYRWQCFVPCGLGYLNGNGGPMSTLGYMGGFLDVVNS